MQSKQRKDLKNEQDVATLHSATLTAQSVPQRVLIAPWGEVQSLSGNFVVDEESADLVAAAFSAHETDLPIDYEHQTLGGTYSSPNGQAPAAGWIKSIEAEPGVGLIARIEWTDPAKEQLISKQYRYLSPVAIVRKHDRKLIAVHSAALTNKPAIVAMPPIVNRSELRSTSKPVQMLRQRLELGDEACDEDVMLAASDRLHVLQREAKIHRIDQRMDEAVRSGRLTEAQREWALELALRDEAMFEGWLRTAPVLVQPGALSSPHAQSFSSSRHTVEAQARAEYQSHPLLAALTNEESYVANAVREAGATNQTP